MSKKCYYVIKDVNTGEFYMGDQWTYYSEIAQKYYDINSAKSAKNALVALARKQKNNRFIAYEKICDY